MLRGISIFAIFAAIFPYSRNLTLFSTPVLDEDSKAWKKLEPKDIEAGGMQLLRTLQGNYITQGGKPKAVKGDVIANYRMFED